jgi:D-sedoheptulose 7-phosphate isomerase
MARLVILDRDGTINVEKHYLSDPGQLELIDNAAQGVRLLRGMGLKVVVVTNQSAVDRGYLDLEALDGIHRRLSELLRMQGAEIDAIYFCPHRPEENCRCRKPGVELLEQAASDFGADLREAFVVGDKSCDIEMGRRVGATTLLVRTGYGHRTLADQETSVDYVVEDLLGAARVIETILNGGASAVRRQAAPPFDICNRDYWGRQIQDQLRESASVKHQIEDACTGIVLTAAQTIARSLANGGKVLLCGNGGSAADCQHIAAEFVGRMGNSERPALPALALTTDTSCLTAIGNDYGFEDIFQRQVEVVGRSGDVLVAISTSGNSPNLTRAVTTARERDITTVGLLGRGGGALASLVHLAIVVPSDNTQRIQEGHITLGHIICDLVERMLSPGEEVGP